MKNQSFHPRKIRIQETPKLDYEQLKARTINALNKLGQQKFSDEPGGYSLENWTKGTNVLLDEFERKIGDGRLTSEYVARRRELDDYLSRPVSTSSMDERISGIRKNIADVENAIDEERNRVSSKISNLKDEEARCSEELAQEKRRISELTTAQSSDSFFKRLLGGNTKASTKNSESKVKELQSRLDAFPGEILEQQRLFKSIDQPAESPLAEKWKELESLQTSLKALEREKLEKTQLVKERQEITASLADAISRMHAPEPNPA